MSLAPLLSSVVLALQAECAASLTSAAEMLLLWEEGALGPALEAANLPQLPSSFPGNVIVYGKEGRPADGLKQIPPLLQTLQCSQWSAGNCLPQNAGEVYVYNVDGLVDMSGFDSLQKVDRWVLSVGTPLRESVAAASAAAAAATL
eukprot:359985-Chlamydomonas_euryale.AAC.12